MRVWRMRTGISITLKPADRRRLKALARDRNAPQSMSGEPNRFVQCPWCGTNQSCDGPEVEDLLLRGGTHHAEV